MTSWLFEGPILPDGDVRRMRVGWGEPEHLPGNYALAGLVDAHCHLTVGRDVVGPFLVEQDTTHTRLTDLARQGVTAVRDTGGDRTITLPLSAVALPGRPLIVACGRFFSTPGRYFPRLYEPVDAADLVGAIVDEIDAGAAWIKLIADFPATDGVTVIPGGRAEPTYDIETVAAAIRVAHDRGVRVAAHTNSAVVSDLVSAGVDSVEHGTLLAAEDISALGGRGGAWTPTLSASIRIKPSDPPERRRRREQTSEAFAHLLPFAVTAGVRVLAGSDNAGCIWEEVALLVDHGLSVEDALAAGTTTAQHYLGIGGQGDLITYHHDPRNDTAVLNDPAAIVVRGLRIK